MPFDPNTAQAVTEFDPTTAKLTGQKGSDIFPQWLQDAAKYGPGFLKEKGKDIVRGFGTTLADLGEGAGALAGEGMRSPNTTNSVKPQEEIRAAVPKDPGETRSEKLFTRMTEGSGGALALPMPGMSLLRQGTAGAAAGFTGEGARRGMEHFAPNSPMLQSAADLIGSIFGGGAATWAMAPKEPVANADIRKSLTGTTEQDFANAQRNLDQANSVGSTTHTVAEAFPGGSPLMTLADKTRNAELTNALKIRTQGRGEDLQGLGAEFTSRIDPYNPKGQSANTVANQTAEAATGAETTLKGLRGEALGNRLEGQILRPQETLNIETNLKALGSSPGTRSPVREAFNEVASKLRDADGKPLTSVQQLSLAIKSLKAAAKNPLTQTATGASISGEDLKTAIGAAERMLGDVNPAFKQGMEEFKDFSRGPMADQTRGPVGTLAFTNPLKEKQASPSKLTALVDNNSPAEVKATMQTLQSPVMTGGPTASATDIASALAGMKLKGAPQNPGAAMRGNPGSSADESLRALLEAGGNNADHVMAPLNVADRLQKFNNMPGGTTFPQMGIGQAFLRPFRTFDMMLTGKNQEAINREVAKLLADGSPGAVKKLQEISMFDPSVRKMLSAKAAVMPLAQEE